MTFVQVSGGISSGFPEGGAKHIMKITPVRSAKLGINRNAADVWMEFII